MNPDNRQHELMEALYAICGMKPHDFHPRFVKSYHDCDVGNFYHHLLDCSVGEWVVTEDDYYYTCKGRNYNLQDGDEFPRAVAEHYGSLFPLELEPWAEAHLNAYILPRYAWLRNNKMDTNTELKFETFDDLMLFRKVSATQAQAILLELLYKAEITKARLFKPHNYTK